MCTLFFVYFHYFSSIFYLFQNVHVYFSICSYKVMQNKREPTQCASLRSILCNRNFLSHKKYLQKRHYRFHRYLHSPVCYSAHHSGACLSTQTPFSYTAASRSVSVPPQPKMPAIHRSCQRVLRAPVHRVRSSQSRAARKLKTQPSPAPSH